MSSATTASAGALILCLCASLVSGCRGSDPPCPAQVVLNAKPRILPPDEYETDITVLVEKEDPNDPREIRTTLSAPSGTFGDVHARETTYTCDRHVAGAVEVCVEGKWVEPDPALAFSEEGGVGSSAAYLQGPHIRDRPDCSSTRCIEVVCPTGPCPEFREILVRPTTQSLGHLVDVRTTVFGSADEAVKVVVESDCGLVADPVQSGDSATTVSCDLLGECSVVIRVVDERYEHCDGFNHAASATIDVLCQLER